MAKYPDITFTMTTCNRIDLFKITMNSFLRCCKDRDLIKRWILVDDGSNETDMEEMKGRFPFFEFYTNEKKGQPVSLNNIFSKVETEWFFHCEDDWLFTKEDKFIRKLFDVSFDNPKIKNITLRYYKGNLKKKRVAGLNYNLAYNLHKYKVVPEYDPRIEITDCNWYGYTFNPALHHLPTLKLLGKLNEDFDTESRYWDKEHARKYYLLGYKRANLPNQYIEHIGGGKSSYVY